MRVSHQTRTLRFVKDTRFCAFKTNNGRSSFRFSIQTISEFGHKMSIPTNLELDCSLLAYPAQRLFQIGHFGPGEWIPDRLKVAILLNANLLVVNGHCQYQTVAETTMTYITTSGCMTTGVISLERFY